MLHCGLLGETLGHSYSPMIHHELGDYDYRLFEVPRERLGSFLTSGSWDGLNVTIPYKKAVVPYCTGLSDAAAKLQSVNTIVRRPDGTLYGDNTDLYGFLYMVRRSGISPAGKKALVLGSGGASVTVKAALEQLGAHVTVISRSGPDNYTNLDRHADAEIIANTTPVGMYPHNGSAAVDLKQFPCCQGVLDIVYNPARTALILQAEELGIPHASGLSMLVAQAKRSSEQFSGTPIDDSALERVERIIHSRLRNIILIGMPGCGKSTVGKALADLLDRPFVDCDREMEKVIGMSVADYITRYGEEAFRAEETAMLTQLGKTSGLVIATGGGCVTRPENYPRLHQNGTMIFLERELSKLPKKGRPLSLRGSLQDMYTIRLPMYRRFADVTVPNDGAPEKVAKAVEEAYERISDQRA